MKSEKFKFIVCVNDIKSIKRATRAIEKITKALKKMNIESEKASASFQRLKAGIPLLLEREVNDNEISNVKY